MNGWEKMMIDGDQSCYSQDSKGSKPEDEEVPMHVGGGSDSRANWATQSELEEDKRRSGAGCLPMIVLGAVGLSGIGCGIYEAVKYFSS